VLDYIYCAHVAESVANASEIGKRFTATPERYRHALRPANGAIS